MTFDNPHTATLPQLSRSFATNFLDEEDARELAAIYGAPLYIYSRAVLQTQVEKALSIPAPFGLTVRYAMKANPHPHVLDILREAGVKIDASSGYEASAALEQGFTASDILVTSQELAANLVELVGAGVQFTACSLRQLEVYGQTFPGRAVSVRINPGIGSGHSQKVSTGGVTSSFGIWHEYIPEVQRIAAEYNLVIERIHTHIGSGTNSAVWAGAADITLDIVRQFSDATIVNMGGGFKVGRMDGEHSTDIQAVGELLRDRLLAFQQQTGRQLHLEVEPGSFLVANAGILVAEVNDVVDTGSEGYKFIKLNTGMTELIRPAMYAAQHPIAIVNDSTETDDFVVVGHCCESSDLFTPDPSDVEKLATRNLPIPRLGDLVLIGGCGAYAASMAAHGYNSFPRAAEVVI